MAPAGAAEIESRVFALSFEGTQSIEWTHESAFGRCLAHGGEQVAFSTPEPLRLKVKFGKDGKPIFSDGTFEVRAHAERSVTGDDTSFCDTDEFESCTAVTDTDWTLELYYPFPYSQYRGIAVSGTDADDPLSSCVGPNPAFPYLSDEADTFGKQLFAPWLGLKLLKRKHWSTAATAQYESNGVSRAVSWTFSLERLGKGR